jgi:serine/threonine-protein kinase
VSGEDGHEVVGQGLLAGWKVLIVDEDFAFVERLTQILREEGARCVGRTQASEVFPTARRERPDLIVAHGVMRDLDGVMFGELLQEDCVLRGTPLVLVAWRSGLLEGLRKMGASAQGYLLKTADRAALITCLLRAAGVWVKTCQRLDLGGTVRGLIEDIGVVRLLSRVCASGDERVVFLNTAAGSTELRVRSGRVVSVRRKTVGGWNLVGEAAMTPTLGTRRGNFLVTHDVTAPALFLANDIVERAESAEALIERCLKRIEMQEEILASRVGDLVRVEVDDGAFWEYACSPSATSYGVLAEVVNALGAYGVGYCLNRFKDAFQAALAGLARAGAILRMRDGLGTLSNRWHGIVKDARPAIVWAEELSRIATVQPPSSQQKGTMAEDVFERFQREVLSVESETPDAAQGRPEADVQASESPPPLRDSAPPTQDILAGGVERSLARLRRVLVHLYTDPARARILAADGGVPLGAVSFQHAPDAFWWELLHEAHKHHRVEALIEQARHDYPENAELADIARLVATAGASSADSELEALQRLRDESSARGQDVTALTAQFQELKRALRNGPQLHPGEYLADRFRLVHRLGHGGFATVWEAFDRLSRGRVAVKVLHGQWSHDQSRIERFERGARAMMQIEHPHVVRLIHPPDTENGFHYFVMEYAAGGDLHGQILGGHLGVGDGLQAIAAVGKALQHAHERGIVHRDVKPENILLRADHTPVLTDFDLVALGDSTGGTRTGALGTFVYAAPEMLMDAKTADHRADVYSLAMTAVFVLARRKLGAEAVRRTAAVVKRLACDERVKEVLLRALDEDPDARFQNVVAFCRALTGDDG